MGYIAKSTRFQNNANEVSPFVLLICWRFSCDVVSCFFSLIGLLLLFASGGSGRQAIGFVIAAPHTPFLGVFVSWLALVRTHPLKTERPTTTLKLQQ